LAAEVVRSGVLSIQVCVPKSWPDDYVLNFAETENPCGTTNGWHIRRHGDESLGGCDERVQCSSIEENCHIMLDA